MDPAGEVFAIVLAGGNGTRLGALTRSQCKPALSFGGQFRTIDFTLSNCMNSDMRRVAVLTQYKAQTLITHLTSSWGFLPRTLGEFIDVWPAQQRLRTSWYRGTADAVYQNLDLLLAQRSRYTLVLAGDHIYKMDYRRLLKRHVDRGAGVTIGCVRVATQEAHAFGVLGVDEHGRVQTFIEKPASTTLAGGGHASVLASMGVYVFTTEYLLDLLTRDAANADSPHDFGRNILPLAVHEHRAVGYSFEDDSGRPGYWRDVGTLDTYWRTHMDLLGSAPAFDLYDAAWPVRTLGQPLPPARLLCDGAYRGHVANSLLGAGSVVRAATVVDSVIATNVEIEEGSMIDQSVVLPNAHIGRNCRLRGVIVDEGARIADGTVVSDGCEVALLTQESSASAMRSVA